jgi:hypothetical protein
MCKPSQDFEVVKHIEDLLATLYSYFNSSPEQTLEFQKLALVWNPKVTKYLEI